MRYLERVKRRWSFLVALLVTACGLVAEGQPPEDTGKPPDLGQGDAGPEADPGDPFVPISVLSLNLHCLKTEGTTYATNEERFTTIARLVKARDVFVILAQEVCSRPGESAEDMLRDALAKETGSPWSSASAFAHRAWEGTPDEADEHVAIFARGENALVGAGPYVHRTNGALARVAVHGYVNLLPRLPRTGGAGVEVFSVHFDHQDAAVRLAQTREIAALAMVESEEPSQAPQTSFDAIVGGDFNAQVGSESLAAMTEMGFVDASGSAGTTRIDHVFVHRTSRLSPLDHDVVLTGPAAVSDHPGVLARFALRQHGPEPVKVTRIVAKGSFGGALTVRGDRAPLSWDRGWPAFPRMGNTGPTDETVFVTTEIGPGPFEFKFLRDDAVWQDGPNASGAGEADNTITPTFP